VTKYQIEELTDLNEYTYFAAKQYYAHPRFRRGVKIVNYHEHRSLQTIFYCHVLHDAQNTCKALFKREEAMSGGPLEIIDNGFYSWIHLSLSTLPMHWKKLQSWLIKQAY
jgi:capsid portal protein